MQKQKGTYFFSLKSLFSHVFLIETENSFLRKCHLYLSFWAFPYDNSGIQEQ